MTLSVRNVMEGDFFFQKGTLCDIKEGGFGLRHI